MMETDSKRVHVVRIYGPKLSSGARGIRLYNIVLLVLYVVQISWVVSTIGEPYRLFLLKADREGFQVMEGATKLRAELEYSFQDIDNPNRRTKKIGYMDWMNMDVEELVEEKKKDRETSVLDSLPKSMRVPHRYTVSFWPSLLLGILAVVHALVLLMQYWSVGFNVWLNFAEVHEVDIPESMMEIDVDMEANRKNVDASAASAIPDRVIANPPSHLPTHARLTPAKGRDVLVPLEYYPTLGMTFEFHRRRFVYQNGGWSKIRCRTNFQLQSLDQWTGLSSLSHIVKAQIRYGPNLFRVRQSKFLDLYKKQLLNPFSVFQVFCVLLWAIDDYIVYSAFSLFMVLVFEATVVFQRLKSMEMLRGMGNPSRNLYVFRNNTWTLVDSTELLPGDVLSLTRVQPHRNMTNNENSKLSKIQDDGGDVVPADVLLLRGSTVVSEASLTGESVPQMKEGLLDIGDKEHLDMKNRHKMNVAYAGTKMLICKGAADYVEDSKPSQLYSQIPPPPDEGCVCFVLRTGFASAQGKLVRMIEGAQEKVKGYERETGLLLSLLCVFAIISSSYVLYHGAQNENRSKYELLLHCILIVTNVIRPELPMQMALAVNNSLMTLMKMNVFCTEPYRVPLAGKLDACLFDKTGTLTSDELIAKGVCGLANLKTPNGKQDDDHLSPMTKVPGEAALVLAGCHSLIAIDDETTGDPLESSALAAMRWHVIPSGHVTAAPATGKLVAGKPIVLANGLQISDIEILARHHFSSKLQRMSCVIKTGSKHFAVAKGSPEAIGRLLASKPNGYDEKSEYFAKQGYRVISLALKSLDSPVAIEKAEKARLACEEGLTFAGFIAFTCMVRKDTAQVLNRLKEGGMSIAMVTGDALLTAIHVAREVGIFQSESTLEDPLTGETSEEVKVLLGGKRPQNGSTLTKAVARPILYLGESDQGSLCWFRYDDGSKARDFVASQIPLLSMQYDLATTGKCLDLAYEYDSDTTSMLQYLKVFARMTPDAKEKVIECLHSVGALCMMTGDGANDVGALKQADVGVALLTGFGNVNVEKDTEVKKIDKKEPTVTAIMSQEHVEAMRALPVRLIKMRLRSMGVELEKYPELVEKEDLVKLYQIKAREIAVKKHDEKNAQDKLKKTQAELYAKQRKDVADRQRQMQEKVMRRAQELEAHGVSWASFKAMREVMGEEMQQTKKQKAEMSKAGGVEGSAAALAAQFEDMETGALPMVKLGDASIAAPFTSKMPSIQNCVDIVRQGRCTLVSSLQMYQIMALQCLISSYSLSVLYLDGVKYGDSQMTAMGLLGSVSFMSVSRSKPLDKLSKVRPLSSIFHPALFVSLLGQFAIHLGTMILSVYQAKKYLPTDYEADLDGSFKPGILNTCVFLVSSVQQVTVYVVNLQGRPFMTGLSENRPLLWSLAFTFILTFMFASESVPSLNRYFQLVPFPDEGFRDFILLLLAVDFAATFVFDRLMKLIFCPQILKASFEGTSWRELFGILRTFAVIGTLMHWLMGNNQVWDELLSMEMNGTSNATIDDSAVGQCLDGLCHAVNTTMNETLNSLAEDL